MHARRTLRSSFVVTLASSALVGMGCGSTVVQAPPVQGDANPPPPDRLLPDVPDDDGSVARPDLGNPPPDRPDAAVPSCPPTPPSGACDPSLSRTCTYGDCMGRPTTEARCAGGTWEVVVSTCNPPPPEVCPPSPPMPNAPCTYAGPPCTWGMCPPTGVTHGMCVNGRWSVALSSCNPPPPDAGPPDA